MYETPGALTRRLEDDFINGTTHKSKYVDFQLYDTLETIDAYLNSKHISGKFDSLDREKPFFNIVKAHANIWYRATDIDRSNIRLRATKSSDWVDSFLASVFLREWMRKENFGVYLNEWGRVLARYCTAVSKVIEDENGLHIIVVPWNMLIVDAVDILRNPIIEKLELSEAELYDRIETHGYDAAQVEALIKAANAARELVGGQQQDNKPGYIKLYELHGKLSLRYLTDDEKDTYKYVQQMRVFSMVQNKDKKEDYDEYTLYRGREKNPYRVAHLIKEDGRAIGIGSVENLFENQWMVNHEKKNVKDVLDMACRVIFQTADGTLVGRNVLTEMETGDIIVHGSGQPLSLVNTFKPEVGQFGEYAAEWKALGNEINGISEAMLGYAPKSGTAWRQTEAILQESYSLFEVMTENKSLALEDVLRHDVIPYLKRKKMKTREQISAALQSHEITRIDALWLKNRAIRQANRKAFVEPMLRGELPTQDSYDQTFATAQSDNRESLNLAGNQRFFKLDEISDKTWADQFKDLEDELEIDITGENENVQSMMTTLSTALKMVVQPGFAQNKKAQAIVGRILELAGAMSPVEFDSIPDEPAPPPAPAPTPTPMPVPTPAPSP